MIKFNFDKFMSSSKKSELAKKTDKSLIWDSLDEENLYNEPEYKNEYYQEYEKEFEADNQPGGDLGELMEKYQLEEWELKDRAKECLQYYRGNKKMPFLDENKTKEILNWYLDYLPTENEYGLPLSEEELNNLKDFEKEQLANNYQERIDLKLKIASLNNKIREVANIIREGQNSDTYSTKVNEAKESLYNLKEEAKDLYNRMQENQKNINSLEKKAFVDKKQEAKEKEEQRKILEEKEYQSKKEKKPNYSEAEEKLFQDCFDYLSKDNKKKSVPEYMGKKLDEEQIINTARDGAFEKIKEGKMMKDNFFVENFNGKRQLASVEKFFDKETKENKRLKFIFIDDKLPPGNYAFKVDPASMFISKKNPNSAMIFINLMINLDKKAKKRVAKEA